MLIDSNILVYAINSSSPKHDRAKKFLQEKVNSLIVTHQNILETLRVITHPKLPSPMAPREALEAVERITEVCRIVTPDYKTHTIAKELIRKHNLSADMVFDAYLTATAMSNDISTIATDNVKDFKKFELTVYNPFEE